MAPSQFDEYTRTELKSFVEKLKIDHYHVVDTLCEAAKKQVLKLNELENHTSSSQYITLCIKLIEEIRNYIQQKNENLIPYLQELLEKDAENHDCSTCAGTGSCNMKHEIQLIDLMNSHKNIKTILYRLQMVVLPLYSETIFPDAYRVLRNQMALLENGLTELFFLEQTFLVPKIKEAQKNINARH